MIYSKQIGKGDVVVFIHGFCETHEIWENIQPQISDSYRTIAIDLPGFGHSDLANRSITIEESAQHVYDHLKHLDINECIIIGHSLGGYVALAIAEEHPEFIGGIVLFHSTAYSDPEEKRLNREKSMAFIDKYGVAPFTDAFIPTLFANNEHVAIPGLLLKAAKTPKATVLKYTEAMKNRKDRTDTLRSFEKPMLIIAGTDDIAVPFVDNELQSKLNNKCKLLKLEGVGHMGMYEQPETCLIAIDKFLKSCGK